MILNYSQSVYYHNYYYAVSSQIPTTLLSDESKIIIIVIILIILYYYYNNSNYNSKPCWFIFRSSVEDELNSLLTSFDDDAIIYINKYCYRACINDNNKSTLHSKATVATM